MWIKFIKKFDSLNKEKVKKFKKKAIFSKKTRAKFILALDVFDLSSKVVY
jgi:hypothetical protein